jgi:transposase
MEKRIEELEAEVKRKDEKIDRLEKRLARYENPHTPPSKQRTSQSESSADEADDEDEDEDNLRADGGAVGRNPGHDPAFRTPPEPDETVDVTLDTCPCCGDPLGEAERVTARLVEEIPEPQPIEVTQYNSHHYTCEGCGEDSIASEPNCPAEGQFGVNVLAETALNRYEYRLPYRKIADRFDQLHDLTMSGASAWHATERAARAGREEYEQIKEAIRRADVVHVDETGMNLDGEQAWIWTFRTDEHTLFVVRESRGSSVPAEVLGEDFAGTIVCDGWTAYPAFHNDLQRCWAHLLREAEAVAADYAAGEAIHQRLGRLYAGLQQWLETDPTEEHRVAMKDQARETLRDIVEMDAEAEDVQKLQTKIDRGFDHWLTFVGEPAVAPTNNAAENALREPVVLRKIIGTLRNENGVFVHETLLTLLATWKQQERNPYEELKRALRDW